MILLALLLCLAFAGAAYAGSGGAANITGATSIGTSGFQPSTNVTIAVNTATTSYCATSVHSGAINNSNGKEYGITSTSTAVVSKTAPTSGTTPDVCSNSTTLPTGMQ